MDTFVELFVAKYPKPVRRSWAPHGPLGLRRLSGAAPGEPEDVERDRVDLRHGAVATKVTNGLGSRATAVVLELLKAAEEHWRYGNGAHLGPVVRAGAKFEKGVLVELPDQPREFAA